MKSVRAIGSALAAAGCLCFGAAAADAQTFVPTDDNNVLKSAPTTVQTNGASFALKEASTAQSNARIGYLKFDLSSFPSISDPVRFTATLAAAATADFNLQLYALKPGAGFDWTESTITYANRPAVQTTDSGVLLDTARVTAVGGNVTLTNGTAAGATSSFTFSGIDAFRQSDNTVTLIFLNSSQSNAGPSVTFASSEATNPAQVPTLTVLPEPTSAAVGGLLAAGALLRRRRCRRA